MVLCSGMRSAFELSDRAFDSSNLISLMNKSRLLIVKMRSEPLPSDAQSDDSEIRTSLHSIIRNPDTSSLLAGGKLLRIIDTPLYLASTTTTCTVLL